ncbi:MAG: VOC family protein [Lautropia sp.]|nr:VOC family protein [Lautropia sp.]
MSIQRLLTNISSQCLQESKDFYVDLFGMVVVRETEWYVHLVSPSDPGQELRIIQRDHPLLPPEWRANPVGMYLTFVVENVDDFHARAVVRGLPIVQPPRDEFYGQRRFLTRDPDGSLIDISSPSRSPFLPPDPPAALIDPAFEQRRGRARMPMRARQVVAKQRRTIDEVLREARARLRKARRQPLPVAG